MGFLRFIEQGEHQEGPTTLMQELQAKGMDEIKGKPGWSSLKIFASLTPNIIPLRSTTFSDQGKTVKGIVQVECYPVYGVPMLCHDLDRAIQWPNSRDLLPEVHGCTTYPISSQWTDRDLRAAQGKIELRKKQELGI
ncbi:hypothetical protein K2X33_05880 [bacterium]|nr:hypothetical protein [bacterium]